MPSDRSLDRLLQEATFFPGLNIRLGGLKATLDIVEHQLDRARLSEAVRLRTKYTSLENDLHPDDKAVDLFNLEQQVLHLLPKTLRGGFLVTLWSVLERSVHDIAYTAATHAGRTLDKRAFHKPFFSAATTELYRHAKVEAFPDKNVESFLKKVQTIRNALVHHDGRQSELPEHLSKLTPAELERHNLYVVHDYDFVYVVPSEQFMRLATETVYSYVHDTAARVFSALVPKDV